MYKIAFFLLILLSFNLSCARVETTSTPTPVSTPSDIALPINPVNTPTPISTATPNLDKLAEQLAQRNPESQIMTQAQIIRDRLRYFGEELKTTYKTDKQKALMENVRATLNSSSKEIENIIFSTIYYEDPTMNEFLTLCKKIDKALATHEPKSLPSVLKDFNSTYDKLESRLSNKPKEKTK